MTSLFLKEKSRVGPAITFLLLEAYQAEQQKVKGAAITAEQQLDLLRAAAVVAGCSEEIDDVRKVFSRLVAKSTEAAEPSPEAGDDERKTGKVIAEYLESLSPDEICFMAADYDLAEARRLYCCEDFESVQHLSKLRTRWEMVKYYSLQEAVNVAFAGTGDDDDDGKPRRGRASGGAVKVSDVPASALNDRLGFLRGTTRH